MSSSYSELIALLTTQSHHGCSLKPLHYSHWKKSKNLPEVIKKEIENEFKTINDIMEPVNCAIENLELFKSDLYQMMPKKIVTKEEKKLISFFTTMSTILNNLHKTNEITSITNRIMEEIKTNQFVPGLESNKPHSDESPYGLERYNPYLPPKPTNNVISDYGITGSKYGTYGIHRRSSNPEMLSKTNEIDSSTSTGLGKNEMSRDDTRTSNEMSSSGVSSAVSEECQHIYANFGDLPSTPDESNLACSEGSITPTNPERSSYLTHESSPSKMKSSTSSTNREPVHFSALKSTKSYPGSPIAESLYSSTGTLSRSNKPAPPPPVRKTSSISDPNAITLGTLRNAGVSTYEEIKTLKRNVRNHSGGNYNTYEELNSDKNAVYHAARKSCLSTSLTSLVEPIYSTLDSNTINISNPFNSKIVPINTSMNRHRRDESKSYSHIHESQQLSTSSRPSSSSSSTLSTHQYLSKAKDDDVLPPPPPEAYSDSENHGYSSHNKIVYMRKEFLQTLNAKLSVPQNQRASPKLVKRLSMSLPHSDQEWDSDSGIASQSSSSNKSSSPGSITSNHSESFAHSLVKRFSAYGGRNSTGTVGHSETSKSRSSNNKSNSSNSTYASFSFSLHKSNDIDSKNISHYDFGRNDVDNTTGTLSKMMLNSSQHSEVAKAAATEAIRRKKSLSESSESFSRENIYGNNPSQSNEFQPNKTSNTNSNYMDRSNNHHQYHQHHSSNPFHNYASEDMQTSDDSVYASRNQSVYQSIPSQPTTSSSGSPATQYPHRRSSQPAALSLPSNTIDYYQVYNSPLSLHPQPITTSNNSNHPYGSNETTPSNSPPNKQNYSLPNYESINMNSTLTRHGSYSSESNSSSTHSMAANESTYSQNNQSNNNNNNGSSSYHSHLHSHQPQQQQTNKSHNQIANRNQNSGFAGAIESLEGAIAARVHNLLANRGSVDLISCRESLMDQIRKGKQLRKVNDQ